MLPNDNETRIESGHLRSGRRVWLGKRRRTVTRRGSCSMNIGEDHELMLHFDKGSCDEEEGN